MSKLSIGGVHVGRTVLAGGVEFEMLGALAVSRNLGILESSLGKFEDRAIATAKRRLGTEARRDIQKQYNIKAGRLSKDLRVTSSVAGLRLTGYFRGIGLRNFGARQTRAGVTVSIFRGKRSLREGAFFVGLLRGQTPLANQHVAKRGSPKRLMTKGSYVGKLRDPLVTQYGPTAAQMLRKGNRPQRLADFALGVVGKEMARQVESHLRRQSGGSK